MPRVKLSVGFSDIKGVQNGSVWSQNGGGLYFRTNHYYGKKQTISQSKKRALMSAVSGIWRNLSLANQTTWIVAAPNFPTTNIFGDPRDPTGYELFMRMNLSLVNAGQSPIATAPSVESFPNYGPVSIATIQLGTFNVATTNLTPAGWLVLIFASRSVSPGVKAIPTNWKLVAVEDMTATNLVDVYAGYSALFGVPRTGEQVFIKTEVIFTSKGIQGATEYASSLVS